MRAGAPAFPVQFGRSFWDDLAADPARSAAFDAQMGADVAAWAPDIVAAYDWGSLGQVVDVGGGNATLLIALLREHPGLRGTVLELPGAAEAAQQAVTAAGFAGRGDAVAGSFFDPLPAGAGGYLLCAVLHNWDDQAAGAILRRCAQAAGRNGRVFVVEKLVTDTTPAPRWTCGRSSTSAAGSSAWPSSTRSPQPRSSRSPRCIPRGPPRLSN